MKTLSEIIDDAEDLKVKISAIKELLSVTVPKDKGKETVVPTVIIKGDVAD